jgi:two-component system, OmpR family, response regulator RegX3
MFSPDALIESPVSFRGLDLDALEQIGSRQRALIIDDEGETINLIKTVLMNAGMDVTGADSGKSALEKIPFVDPDIILLDLMMPDMDGWETFLRLKKVTQAPIIFLTAKNLKEDVVKGLRFGVDDYISKPFHPAELIARIHTLMKRNHSDAQSLTFNFPTIDLKIDLETREATIRGKSVYLPPKEMNVLTVLAKNPGKWVSNRAIAMGVWGDDSLRVVKRIKYLIFLLRREMEDDPANPTLILSRESLGYKLDVTGGNGANKGV